MRKKLPNALRTGPLIVAFWLAVASSCLTGFAGQAWAQDEAGQTSDPEAASTAQDSLATRKARREEELSALTRDLTLSEDRQAAIAVGRRGSGFPQRADTHAVGILRCRPLEALY